MTCGGSYTRRGVATRLVGTLILSASVPILCLYPIVILSYNYCRVGFDFWSPLFPAPFLFYFFLVVLVVYLYLAMSLIISIITCVRN